MDYSAANKDAVQAGTNHREKMKKEIALWARIAVFSLGSLILLIWLLTSIRSNLSAGSNGTAVPTVSWIWIVILIIAAIAVALIFKYEEKWQRIGIAATAIVLAIIVITKMPPLLPGHTRVQSPFADNHSSAPMSASDCHMPKTAYHFAEKEPSVPFNPNGACGPDLWINGNCVMVRAAGHKPELYCPGDPNNPKPLPLDVAFVWSAGAAFDGYVGLSPPRYQQAHN